MPGRVCPGTITAARLDKPGQGHNLQAMIGSLRTARRFQLDAGSLEAGSLASGVRDA